MSDVVFILGKNLSRLTLRIRQKPYVAVQTICLDGYYSKTSARKFCFGYQVINNLSMQVKPTLISKKRICLLANSSLDHVPFP